MKQLFLIGFCAVFFSFFVCNFFSDTAIAAVPQFEENQPSKKNNAKEKVPVLIELFTAEACPMCPPADKNLVRLEKEQPFPEVEIITLSLHVDYWERARRDRRIRVTDVYSPARYLRTDFPC